MHARTVRYKAYQQNEKRPWSEFRPVLATAIIGLHLLAAGAIAWHIAVGFWPSATTWAMTGVMYLSGFGIALGYHRLFTHRGYECSNRMKAILLFLGGLTLEGPAAIWVPNHWQHHARSDQPGDVHSPYQYHGSFWLNIKGILWSETGWLFYDPQRPESKRDPFADDKLVQWQWRNYSWIIATSLGFPALVCGAVGLVQGGWQLMLIETIDGFLIAGVLRIVVFLFFTGGINSICHLVGKQVTLLLYEIGPDGKTRKKICPSDGSRNFWLLAIFTFGEAYHALHHLFQQVAYHGWSKWAIDPSKWVLIVFEKLGWVWDVKKPPTHEVVELEVMLPPDSLIRPFSQAPDDDRTMQAA